MWLNPRIVQASSIRSDKLTTHSFCFPFLENTKICFTSYKLSPYICTHSTDPCNHLIPQYSAWYNPKAPVPYINLLTTMLFHAALPITKPLPECLAAQVTIPTICFFHLTYSDRHTLKTDIQSTSDSHPLYSFTPEIVHIPKIHSLSLMLPSIQITFDFASLTFTQYHY